MYGKVFLMTNQLINNTINCIGWHRKEKNKMQKTLRESHINMNDISQKICYFPKIINTLVFFYHFRNSDYEYL